jgi:hypothetical protein
MLGKLLWRQRRHRSVAMARLCYRLAEAFESAETAGFLGGYVHAQQNEEVARA